MIVILVNSGHAIELMDVETTTHMDWRPSIDAVSVGMLSINCRDTVFDVYGPPWLE